MKYMTAGESHGPQLTAIVEGVPAGLHVSEESINADLARRQAGYGRSARQSIENDRVKVLSGVRFGRTLGTPVTLSVENADWQNWSDQMAAFGQPPADSARVTCPRPGHADLVGVLKADFDDCRDVIERASARETAARVAAAGVAREFLADLGVEVFSFVVSIGQAKMHEREPLKMAPDYRPLDIELSDVRCPNEAAADAMRLEIDKARDLGDTLGGTFRVVARGLVPGLGGYASAGERLSSRIASALFSIPAVKGVEFGLGFDCARLPGSQVNDLILIDPGNGFPRATNNSGGIEGGMTTGMPLIVTCAMKPIPTLGQPMGTIDLDTLDAALAATERADICAVPACAVVAEAELAFVLANAYLEKFGHDNMTDIRANVAAYRQRLKTASR